MPSYSKTLKLQAETALTDPNFDFIATYHAITDLRRLAKNRPEILDEQTVLSLKALLLANPFPNARQGYFLHREAAKGLTDIVHLPGINGLGEMALASLQELLTLSTGNVHRGVAEAVGSLPVPVSGPRMPTGSHSRKIDRLSWPRMISANHLTIADKPEFFGRSLVARIRDNDRFLVVKLAKRSDTANGLAKEIRWMKVLRRSGISFKRSFHIPRPLLHAGHDLFQATQLPLRVPDAIDRHPEGWAIAFLAHRDYFIYPNSDRIDSSTALEILGRNAFLFGRLCANGIIHDAPIPLFHNRTQRLRRQDQGRYQWFRAGRLDQWFDSCAFPNLGLSGVRDFEHFESLTGEGLHLYRHIGTHLFSLLLIAGSHFRCKDRSRMGLDENQKPVDATALFDRQILKKMVQSIYAGYYEGFTEIETIPPLPLNLDTLIDRMIDEMGVDRYMTELFRRTDQKDLTDEAFASFLKSKGYRADCIRELKRGEKDILITSGPHLGDFNRQISLPELIECTATMAAMCIAGRYQNP